MAIVVSFQVSPTQVDVQQGGGGECSWGEIKEEQKEWEASASTDRHFCREKTSSQSDICEINSVEGKN